MPAPPTEKVRAFGDVEEEVPVWDDPEYQEALSDYYWQVGHDQVGLIAAAVEISGAEAYAEELAELEMTGLHTGDDKADLLRYILLDDRDVAGVVEAVFYNSTVTERGIQEATELYAVTWQGRPVQAWRVPRTPGRYGLVFEARRAARYGGYEWRDFCTLTGPEQSAEVAFYRLEGKLQWLMSERQRMRSNRKR